jgi:hypothetical protein
MRHIISAQRDGVNLALLGCNPNQSLKLPQHSTRREEVDEGFLAPSLKPSGHLKKVLTQTSTGSAALAPKHCCA